ncbi:MAG: YxeA family protein [Ruminococcaceae bacterium]|nr:YxeA family protein [Oscillospiraceae bacterium]
MKKAIIIIGTVFVLFAAALSIVVFVGVGVGDNSFYARVDNTKVKDVMDNDMRFSYSLPAVSSSGEKKTVEFMTYRRLREGALLKLKLLPLRGVTDWEEVQWNDLPDIIKSVFPNAESRQ